jgi:hypothetical protein
MGTVIGRKVPVLSSENRLTEWTADRPVAQRKDCFGTFRQILWSSAVSKSNMTEFEIIIRQKTTLLDFSIKKR